LLIGTAWGDAMVEGKLGDPVACGAPAPLDAVPSVPDPLYGVGSREVVLIDPNRPTQARPARDLPAKPERTISTLLFYPTDGDPSGPAVRDAPVAHQQFPLVVFTPGGGGDTGPTYARMVKPLVQRGYVVALPTFPLAAGGRGVWADYVNQPADVSFVIDETIRLSDEPGEWLSQRVNQSRIGVAGNSLGAVVALGLTCHSGCIDQRIEVAALAGATPLPFPGGGYVWPDTPLLFIHGTQDDVVPVEVCDSMFDRSTGETWYVRLSEADHLSLCFGDHRPITQLAMLAVFDAKLKDNHELLRRMGNVMADSGRGDWLAR